MLGAVGWGAFAASSLVIGGLLGLLREWHARLVGSVLAFGAGALISAGSFDLFEEGSKVGGPLALAFGLAAGALTYFSLNRLIERKLGGGAGLALGSASPRGPRRARRRIRPAP